MSISRNFRTPNRQRPVRAVDPINENIRAREVRVIDPDGNQLGIMSRNEAIALAQDKFNLDLFCVAPNANPPVCKILNYGKYRFEEQKRAKEIKRNQKIVELKEVRMTPVIDTHDLNVKVQAAIRFLKDGNRVKVAIRFRGRQMSHIDVGEAVMDNFIAQVEEHATVEKKPYMEGRFLNCILASKHKK